MEILSQMHAHIREDISECMERFNTDDDPDCFVHAYKKMAEDDPKELK